MTPQEKARVLRPLIEKAAASLSDFDSLEAVELFPSWENGIAYAVKQRVRYRNKLYRCVQAHVALASWEPPVVPALWTEVSKPGEIPVWQQPMGAHSAYMVGDLVYYPDAQGAVYRSLIDNNNWSPEVYPQGWEEISDASSML